MTNEKESHHQKDPYGGCTEIIELLSVVRICKQRRGNAAFNGGAKVNMREQEWNDGRKEGGKERRTKRGVTSTMTTDKRMTM